MSCPHCGLKSRNDDHKSYSSHSSKKHHSKKDKKHDESKEKKREKPEKKNDSKKVDNKSNKKKNLEENYTILFSELSGNNAVPPVRSTMSGKIEIRLAEDRSYLRYRVEVHNVSTSVLGGTLNLGAPGKNGPVVKQLSAFSKRKDRYYSEGSWKSSDSVDPLDAKRADELLKGLVYVNVSTYAVNNGEVRGQIKVINQ